MAFAPHVQNFGMRVQEGVKKTITEFELKAVDADTEVGALASGPMRCLFFDSTSQGQGKGWGEVIQASSKLKARTYHGLLEKKKANVQIKLFLNSYRNPKYIYPFPRCT